VVHLSRNLEDVKEALEDESRARLNDDVETLWKRREPLYRKVSEFEFHIYAMVSRGTEGGKERAGGEEGEGNERKKREREREGRGGRRGRRVRRGRRGRREEVGGRKEEAGHE
jgi:hypothetical protein